MRLSAANTTVMEICQMMIRTNRPLKQLEIATFSGMKKLKSVVIPEQTALPIFNKVYVAKKAKKTYIKWAKDKDGLKRNNLHTF